MKVGILLVLLLVACAAIYGFAAMCPCERTPGLWLLGEQASEPVRDWSFANDVGLCQLEVPGIVPHSINLNCMASDSGQLYLSCSRCDGKYWSTIAMREGRGRIRIGETVFGVSLTRVSSATELDVAWLARADKTTRGDSSREVPPRPDHWWSFRLESSLH